MKTSAFKGDFKLTSAYGWRTHPITGVKAFHNGVDFGMVTGSELIVPPKFNNSVVRLTLTDKYGGKYLQLQNKSNGKGYYVLHISSFKKKVGDTVKTGDLIALSGNTGNSTGAHTHIGVQKDATVWGSCEDPMPYIILENTQMFKKGDKIIFTGEQNIRKGSGTSYAVTGTATVGMIATIEGEPRVADNYTWYDLVDNNWVADVGKFKIYVAPPTPDPTPDCTAQEKEIVRLEGSIKTLTEKIKGLELKLGLCDKKVLDMKASYEAQVENLEDKLLEQELESEEKYESLRSEKDRIAGERNKCQIELSKCEKASPLKELIDKIFDWLKKK